MANSGNHPGPAHQNLDVNPWCMVTSGDPASRSGGRDSGHWSFLPKGVGHGSRGETICCGDRTVFCGVARPCACKGVAINSPIDILAITLLAVMRGTGRASSWRKGFRALVVLPKESGMEAVEKRFVAGIERCFAELPTRRARALRSLAHQYSRNHVVGRDVWRRRTGQTSRHSASVATTG